MALKKIVVTPRGFAKCGIENAEIMKAAGFDVVYNDTGLAYTEEEFYEVTKDADGVIVGVETVNREYIDTHPKLKAVVGYGTTHMRTVCLFYFLMAFSHGVSAILRGTGKSIIPMGVIMFAWCGFRMVYVSIATKLFEGIQAVFWVYPISWALSAGIFLLYILKVNWMGNAKE